MKRYYATTDGETEIKVSCSYDLGGMNYFNQTHDQRGYYVSVYPMKRIVRGPNVSGESFGTGKGFKELLFSVARRSAKHDSDAESMVAGAALGLAERMADEEGLELTGSFEEVED